MHLKRNSVPRRWPIARKGTKFVVQPNNNAKTAVSVLMVLRDMLEIAKIRKDAKSMIHQRQIEVNSKIITDEKYSMTLYDKIHLKKSGKFYELGFENRKMTLKEVDEKQAKTKIVKISNKKILEKNKTQINFNDGRNLLTNENLHVGDSVVLNLAENKIEEVLPVKKGSKAIVIAGKHLGKIGSLESLDEPAKTAVLKYENSDLNISFKNLMVIK